MLTLEQIAGMSMEELKQARNRNSEQFKLNSECRMFAAGVACKWKRGGTKLRVWRVAKPDKRRVQDLEEEGKAILREGMLLSDEIKRRSHVEEARA